MPRVLPMMTATFPAHVLPLVPPIGMGDVGKRERHLARKALRHRCALLSRVSLLPAGTSRLGPGARDQMGERGRYVRLCPPLPVGAHRPAWYTAAKSFIFRAPRRPDRAERNAHTNNTATFGHIIPHHPSSSLIIPHHSSPLSAHGEGLGVRSHDNVMHAPKTRPLLATEFVRMAVRLLIRCWPGVVA
jgi:hypothetical protein